MKISKKILGQIQKDIEACEKDVYKRQVVVRVFADEIDTSGRKIKMRAIGIPEKLFEFVIQFFFHHLFSS